MDKHRLEEELTYKEILEKYKKRLEFILENKENFNFYMNIENIQKKLNYIIEMLKIIEDIECVNEECYTCIKKDICPLGIKISKEDKNIINSLNKI